MSYWELLITLDEQLFHLINGVWRLEFFDRVMPWWREKSTWIPLYLLLVVFFAFKFRWKALALVLGLIVCVGLADFVSTYAFKKNVKRLRPCHNVELKDKVSLLVPCGGQFSFTSNHAANHFAFAFFLTFVLGASLRRLKWALLFWAASIAYGQVYVGVHYPLDVLAGALLGVCIAFAFSMLFNRLFSLEPTPKTTPPAQV